MSLKDNLRYYREKSGFSARKFAAHIGIPYNTYANYEIKGTWASEENLNKIARALNVSFNDLLGSRTDAFSYYKERIEKDGVGIVKETEDGKVLVTLFLLDSPRFEPSIVMTKDEFTDMCREAEKNPKDFHNDIKVPFTIKYARSCYEKDSSPVPMPSEIPDFDEPEYDPDAPVDFSEFGIELEK